MDLNLHNFLNTLSRKTTKPILKQRNQTMFNTLYNFFFQQNYFIITNGRFNPFSAYCVQVKFIQNDNILENKHA